MAELITCAHGPQLLFGMSPVVQPVPDGDEVRGRLPTDGAVVGPDGRFSVGALGVLADDTLGWSLIASLPPGAWTVSTEIWLDVVGPLPLDGRPVRAAARTLQTGSFSTGTVTDDDGHAVAVIRERGRPIAQDLRELDLDGPSGLVVPATREVVTLLGLEPAGTDRYRMRVGPGHENPRHMLHGGLSFCASEAAATWSRVRAGSDLATSSVHIVHTRAIPAGSVVDFVVTGRHTGRGLWVSDVEGVVDGRICTLARVTAGPDGD